MSDRLISADKAREVLKHLLYETAMDNDIDIAEIYEDIAERRLDTWIELIPTVDAVPVVRCKDCKYYIADGCDECELMSAKSIIASIKDKRWYSDFFCAWGERKNGQ